MADDTLLVLEGIGIPSWSARGLTQTLAPIQQAAQLSRSINAVLQDLSFDSFKLYASKISCSDQRTLPPDNLWPGSLVTVSCVAELRRDASGSATRAVVASSERTEGTFVFYRPKLDMTVTGFNVQIDEYGATVSWELDLEETGESGTA